MTEKGNTEAVWMATSLKPILSCSSPKMVAVGLHKKQDFFLAHDRMIGVSTNLPHLPSEVTFIFAKGIFTITLGEVVLMLINQLRLRKNPIF